ncbi:MAG: hypothetical protein J6J33_04060 [Clostridia bacterium]|nr:hypothetical protein [Clostridia bacterium]
MSYLTESPRVDFEFRQRIHTGDTTVADWKNVDIRDPEFLQKIAGDPLVIGYGGIGTTSDKDSSYVAKFIHRLIGVGDLANIISIKHSHIKGENFARFFDENPEELFALGMEEAFKIGENLIFPRVLDENGNKLPAEMAAHSMRDVTIFAHCYGYFSSVQYLENVLEYYLKNELGYSQAETDFIMEQIFVLSYEVGDIYKTKKFKNFNISSLGSELWKDTVLNFVNRDFSNVQMLDGEKEKIIASKMFQTKDPALVEKFIKNNEYVMMREGNVIDLYTEQITLDGSDHDLSTIYRHKDTWLPGYFTTENGDYISQAAAISLAIAVANSMKNRESTKLVPIDMQDMFEQISSVLQTTRTHFGIVNELQV